MNALLDNEWDAYLEREGEILAAKEERNAKAAGMPTKKRAPRMSEEELAADAAAFAQAAMQEDAEAASDDAGDGNAANADGNTDATNSSCSESLCGETCGGFSFERYVDWGQT